MIIRRLVSTLAVAAILAACGVSGTKLDATDGITLDGTFREAIEGLSPSDQLKASAGMLMLSYGEVAVDEEDYFRSIEEAKEEASYMLGTDGSGFFATERGEVFNEIARETGSVLDGKSAQDLIDHYNLTTGQYDEYQKDREEAEAEAERAEAARLEAERVAAVNARRTELQGMLSSLDAAKAANDKTLADLEASRKAAQDAVDAARAKGEAMTGDVTPAKGLQRLSDKIGGQVNVTIINTTDEPIKSPIVHIGARPADGGPVTWHRGDLGMYKGENKGKTIAPGASRDTAYRPTIHHDKNSPLRATVPEFTAYVVGYQTAGGEKVSLRPEAKALATLEAYPGRVEACKAANAAVAEAGTTIPAAISALDQDGADAGAAAGVGNLRC